MRVDQAGQQRPVIARHCAVVRNLKPVRLDADDHAVFDQDRSASASKRLAVVGVGRSDRVHAAVLPDRRRPRNRVTRQRRGHQLRPTRRTTTFSPFQVGPTSAATPEIGQPVVARRHQSAAAEACLDGLISRGKSAQRFGTCPSRNRLTDGNEIPLAVVQPRGTLAQGAGGRIVPIDRGDAVPRRCGVSGLSGVVALGR